MKSNYLRLFIFSQLCTLSVFSQKINSATPNLSKGIGVTQQQLPGNPGGGPIDTVPTIADRVTFTYDVAGNQYIRQICINCTTNKQANVSNITDKINESIVEEDGVKYYPNPVTEDLFIDFKSTNSDKSVSFVEVYTLSGQTIKRYDNVNKETTLTIPFYDLSQGIYLVNIVYNNGDVDTTKITKK